MADGFDYNSWAAMNLNKGSGDSGSGEAMTPDTLIKKGIDSTAKTFLNKIAGLPISIDIDGKSAMAGFESEEGIGKGFSPTGGGIMGMLRDLPGGVMAQIFKYFTRDVPQILDGSAGGGGGDYAGAATGGASGGGDDMMSSGGGYQGGGDFHGHAPIGEGPMPEAPQINYGGRMVSAEALVADLGNLQPTSTPAAADRGPNAGMEI